MIGFVLRRPRTAVLMLWLGHALTLVPAGLLAAWLLNLLGDHHRDVGAVVGTMALLFIAFIMTATSPLHSFLQPRSGKIRICALALIGVGFTACALASQDSLFTAMSMSGFVMLCMGQVTEVAELMPWMVLTKSRQVAYFQHITSFPLKDIIYPSGKLKDTIPEWAMNTMAAHGLTLSPPWLAIAQNQMGAMGCLVVGWLTHAPGRALDARERLDRALPAAGANVARRPRL